MHLLKSIVHVILLITTLSLSLPLQASIPVYRAHVEKRILPNLYTLSYDDVMLLLEEIDLGHYEELSYEEFQEIDEFIAVLAKEGKLPGDSEDLDEDIEAFLSVYDNQHEILLCDWFSKGWRSTQKFLNKHKKAIIIGAAIVVATVAVVGIVAASSAGAAGGAATANKKEKRPSRSQATKNVRPAQPIETSLKETISEQAALFKENLAAEKFFDTSPELSLQENGRALGSVFAHETLQNLSEQPYVFHDIANASYNAPVSLGHLSVDRQFATEYSTLFASQEKIGLTTLSYQARGIKASEFGYYNQAVADLGKAIEFDPSYSLAYLERGMAHFALGDYDRSLEDYYEYVAHTPTYSLSLPEFSLGFAKGLPHGIYESGKGIFILMSDLVTQPIHTAGQMWDALSMLASLVHSQEWEEISKALAPEIHHLVMQWDTLPSQERGELAGYAFGKHGSDILIPGALVKTATKGAKTLEALTETSKRLLTAEKTFCLESLASSGTSEAGKKLLLSTQKALVVGEELGYPTHQLVLLKQAGTLESTISGQFSQFAQAPTANLTYQMISQAEKALESYKGFMPEAKARDLIHQTGMPTFQRPAGIPDNYRVEITNKGAGMKYVHPKHPHTYIRVMPGKPHSPLPYQQKPYVVQVRNGMQIDTYGNIVSKNAPEAHIPLAEYVFEGGQLWKN